MSTTFRKLETFLLSGGDIGIPTAPDQEWILIDAEDTELSAGKTLEDAVSKLPLSSEKVTFESIPVGSSFLFDGEPWKKVNWDKAQNNQLEYWFFLKKEIVTPL